MLKNATNSNHVCPLQQRGLMIIISHTALFSSIKAVWSRVHLLANKFVLGNTNTRLQILPYETVFPLTQACMTAWFISYNSILYIFLTLWEYLLPVIMEAKLFVLLIKYCWPGLQSSPFVIGRMQLQCNESVIYTCAQRHKCHNS